MSRLVLVIEDDVAFRRFVTRILIGWGHDVVEAGTGAEARARAAERRPDVALTDIGLPDVNGFDLTQELVGIVKHVRVVVISSDAGAGNKAAALRAGAVGFVPKDELFGTAVRQLIDG
jgi:CheY-like chemotaxis protein